MTVETDGYDPWADPEQTPQGVYDLGVVGREYLQQLFVGGGNVSPPRVGGVGGAIGTQWPQAAQYFTFGGGGGGGAGGGGGGAGITSGSVRIEYKQPEISEEERQEMTWSNPEAADIAREILQDEKREGLREKITEAVAHYREMLEGAHCGSVFSFMKENDEGKHYWYAAIKNGDKWYTTAQNPRVIDNDDAFITWLVGLGAHESAATELTQGAAKTALALGPIDSTATDES